MTPRYEVRFFCGVYRDHYECVKFKEGFDTLEAAKSFKIKLFKIMGYKKNYDVVKRWFFKYFYESLAGNFIFDGIWEITERQIED